MPRNQYLLFPPIIEDWIPQTHPARIIDLFVESLDPKSLGVVENNDFTGRPNYSPKLLLKIILYGYSNGERSSRVLERKTYEDIAYIWLTGNLHPDYRTIARFRQNNISALKSLLKETLRLYETVGIDFDGIIFSDGTKVYANANDKNIATPEKIQKLEKIAEAILNEAKDLDNKEDQAMGDANRKFFKAEKLAEIKDKIAKCKEALETGGDKVSLTDKDAGFMKHIGHGKHLSYNGQLSVERNGIIVETDVVTKPSDDGELLKARVKSAEANLAKEVKKAIADACFFETNAIKGMMNEGKSCIVPKQTDVKRERGKNKVFDIKDFKYEKERDEYICPGGKRLALRNEKTNRGKEYLVYAAKNEECLSCPLSERCYKGKGGSYGRSLMVLKDRDFLEAYEQVMVRDKGLLEERKSKIEPVIGFIKSHLRFRRFLLRGLEKVKGEWSLIAVVHNLIKIWRIIKGKLRNRWLVYQGI
jgi:transposase